MERFSNNENQEPVRPIAPEEVLGAKLENFPPEVLETVNRLIAKNIRYGSATVLQKDIVNALTEMGHSRREVYDNHWLDFEDIYRDAGWNVSYDKPGYNETYDAFFEFRAPKRQQRLGARATRECTCRD
jgi:hypothetical protein